MCALDEWTVDELAALVRRAAHLRRAVATTCSHNVLDLLAGPLPVRRVRRAAPAHRVGPGRRHRARPRRRPAPGGHQRRHHPRSRAVRRVPARRHPGGRARRGDGLREPAGRDVPARARARGASRTSPTSGSSSRPRPASPGKMPFWHGDGPGPPARAGPGRGRVRARGAGRAAPTALERLQRDDTASTSWPPRNLVPTSTSRPRPPARCPTTAPSWSSASATRSATGGSACSRRSAPRCTRRGPWRCRPAWPSGGASTSS